MLCYRCGSHVPDTADTCPTCGQNLAAGGLRQATGTFSRRRPGTSQIEGAPFKAQDVIANRYQVKDTVGAGPLGYVFRAHDKEVDVEVAVKVINPNLLQTAEERKAFAKLLRGARKLSHPNLVRVYEEGEDADRPYFTSQYLDGLTLRKIIDLRLQKGAFFTLHEIEPIVAQICAALEGAHKVGPHSDLKPDNVLVLPDLLKVTDFSLGLAMPRLPFVQAMKAKKADRYLAPELIDGGEVDERIDVYSVGVILGEMLSGLTPDGSPPELSRRNPDVPTAVEGLYRKAVNANPIARFKTPGELIGELAEQVKKLPSPHPAKLKVEAATGPAPAPRPRSATGMLQLQPRRDQKPPPPVPDLPVPSAPSPGPGPLAAAAPPPVSSLPPLPLPIPPSEGTHSGEFLADATQPVDPEMLAIALKASANGAAADARAAEDAKLDRQQTAVIDSEKFVASVDPEDLAETRAFVSTIPPPSPPSATAPDLSVVPSFFAHERQRTAAPSNTMLVVVALVVLGVLVGGGGGYYLLQEQKAEEARAAEAKLAEQKAAEDRAAAERAAAAAAKAAEEKAAAERAAAEKAANERRTPAERAAAKAAAERALRLAAEKAAAEKAAAEKAAAEKAAADKAAADKAAADKAAADKAAADKAAKEATTAPSGTKPLAPVGTCPDEMRPIAAGAFKMGTAPGDSMMSFDEKALASVEVPSFCIDTYEYPNKKGATVVAGVGFADAKTMCQNVGKRLCSEAEWEKACKGPAGAKWPYGGSFDATACNTENEDGDPRTVAFAGRFAKCRSGYGVADLSGNVSEWTAEKIIKGGSYASSDYAVRCSARKNSGGSKNSEVGFRCCVDLR